MWVPSGLTRLLSFFPTQEPSSEEFCSHSAPCTWSDAWGCVGGSVVDVGVRRFAKMSCMHPPSLTRMTSGRGRLSLRSCTLPALQRRVESFQRARQLFVSDSSVVPLGKTSRARANIWPFGRFAPSRLSVSCWLIATT